MGVLTPGGTLIVEPTLEYTRSSANRLVFRGVEIVPGVQLGVIDANDADRDSIVGTLTARYGLGDRFEIEGRIPYVYRHDRVTTLAQRDESITRTTKLEANDIGDIEVSARYQLTRGLPGDPIFVANARVKPPTGKSPYDVEYDEFGVATSLATGSGFWAAEVGVTMLYPTDPAVIFGGISYLYHIPRDINKVIGEVMVGRVDPGDSIGANIEEGHGRLSRAEYIRFLDFARGSARETRGRYVRMKPWLGDVVIQRVGLIDEIIASEGRLDIAHGPKSRVARDLMRLVAERLEAQA